MRYQKPQDSHYRFRRDPNERLRKELVDQAKFDKQAAEVLHDLLLENFTDYYGFAISSAERQAQRDGERYVVLFQESKTPPFRIVKESELTPMFGGFLNVSGWQSAIKTYTTRNPKKQARATRSKRKQTR